MNKIIKDQLNKVRSVKLEYDDSTTNLVIPRVIEVIPQALNEGDIYLIKLNDNVLHPASNSTLASNWNCGKVPRYSTYQVEFLEKMGTMYKFNGIAIDNGTPIYSENWFGWFPENGFTVISKL